jgi:hypothetical protein
MVRWLVIGGVAVLALTIYALVDLFVTASNRLRAFPKPVWIGIIVILPLIGPALWLLIGKNRPAVQQKPVAPDDDPRFMGTLSESAEERIRRLEEELRALDDEDNNADEQSDGDPDEGPGDQPGDSNPPTPPRV